MEEQVRKYIRKIISEIGGKQDDIHNSAEKITKIIVDFLNTYLQTYASKINDGNEWEFVVPEIPTEFFKEKTGIGKIKTKVEFTFSQENKLNGKFYPDKKILLNDNSYEILLLISIKAKNDIKTFSYELEEIIAHELNHAFRDIKLLNKKSKANSLNQTKNFTIKQLQPLLKTNPPIKEFMEMIYLSLPPETAARVQQTAIKLKTIENTNINQTIESLRQYQPLRDAKRMINYSTEEIKKINPETIKLFIDTFNQNLTLFSDQKTKNDTNAFLKHWGEIINEKGDELFRKIMRLISDKYNLQNENILIDKINEKLLFEISGYNLYN